MKKKDQKVRLSGSGGISMGYKFPGQATKASRTAGRYGRYRLSYAAKQYLTCLSFESLARIIVDGADCGDWLAWARCSKVAVPAVCANDQRVCAQDNVRFREKEEL